MNTLNTFWNLIVHLGIWDTIPHKSTYTAFSEAPQSDARWGLDQPELTASASMNFSPCGEHEMEKLGAVPPSGGDQHEGCGTKVSNILLFPKWPVQHSNMAHLQLIDA